jgi:chromate transport protein ChrA
MSAPEPNPQDSQKDPSNAIVWALVPAAVAVGLLMYAGRIEPDKQKTYYILAGLAAVITAVNGYSAWALYKKANPPAPK